MIDIIINNCKKYKKFKFVKSKLITTRNITYY